MATDFFLSNNLVEISKVNNMRRYLCQIQNSTYTELNSVLKVLKSEVRSQFSRQLMGLVALSLDFLVNYRVEVQNTLKKLDKSGFQMLVSDPIFKYFVFQTMS